MSLGYLAILQITGPGPLAGTEGERCYLARLVLRTGRDAGLVGWRAQGPHLRLVCLGDRRAAGQLARRVGIGAQQVVGRGMRFAAARFQPIEDRPQLGTVLADLLRRRADLGPDPDRFHTASAAPDLLGLRRAGAYLRPRLRRSLPAPSRSWLLSLVGPGEVASHIEDWRPLQSSTAAVFGHADLARRWPWRPRALAAAAELAAPLLGTADTAALLGVSPSALRRARSKPVRPALVRAVQEQLRWRQTGETWPGPRLACGTGWRRRSELRSASR